jgi:copper chaperone CopZ
MSWYQDKTKFFIPNAPNIRAKNMLLPVTLTNLKSANDEAVIINGLQKLEGVDHVKIDFPQKKVYIYFNPQEIRIETITYTLLKLGFHYVQRS